MYTYKAKVTRVVDGDTVDALIDLGFDTHVKKRIRLYGMDAWESRTRNKEEKVNKLRTDPRELGKIFFGTTLVIRGGSRPTPTTIFLLSTTTVQPF